MTPDRMREILKAFKPMLRASLDATCIVGRENEIILVNLAMKNFLGIGAKELKGSPCFCQLIKLAACGEACQVIQAMESGESLRLDETPAIRKKDRLRLLVKIVPVFDPFAADPKEALGAIVTLRDTTAEVLLQAKYRKLIEMVDERNDQIRKLEAEIRTARAKPKAA